MRYHGRPGRQPLVHRSRGNRIGRITTTGVVTEFSIASPPAAARSDRRRPGRQPLVHRAARQQDRPDHHGRASSPSSPSRTAGSVPIGIAAGPDGNLWFTEDVGNRIGRITTAGVVTEFPFRRASSEPVGIAAGPDGNLWFTESERQPDRPDHNGRRRHRVPHPTPTASRASRPAPTATSGSPNNANNIGRITTGPCTPDTMTLCLSGSRFGVQADWQIRAGAEGHGTAVRMTGDAGYFWFFGPANVEVVVKVLPFCADPYNSIWIFAAA